MTLTEWFATAWEMNFGTQIDENVATEPSHTNERTEIQDKTDEQNDNMDNAVQPSPNSSNLTTDVGDNPYFRRLHPLKVHLNLQNTAYDCWV